MVMGSSKRQSAWVACIALSFVLCLGGSAQAESATPILQILSAEEESFGTFESPHGVSNSAPMALSPATCGMTNGRRNSCTKTACRKAISSAVCRGCATHPTGRSRRRIAKSIPSVMPATKK